MRLHIVQIFTIPIRLLAITVNLEMISSVIPAIEPGKPTRCGSCDKFQWGGCAKMCGSGDSLENRAFNGPVHTLWPNRDEAIAGTEHAIFVSLGISTNHEKATKAKAMSDTHFTAELEC